MDNVVAEGSPLGQIIAAGVALLVALFLGGGGFLWIMRTLVGALVKNMEAHTRASDHNATATQQLATNLEVDTKVRVEREVRLFEQLGRIELGVKEVKDAQEE